MFNSFIYINGGRATISRSLVTVTGEKWNREEPSSRVKRALPACCKTTMARSHFLFSEPRPRSARKEPRTCAQLLVKLVRVAVVLSRYHKILASAIKWNNVRKRPFPHITMEEDKREEKSPSSLQLLR